MLQQIILLTSFFVSFTDKAINTPPALSDRALEQRAKWNIALDELDYPVNAAYLDSLREYGASIYHTSRWMNGATVEMTDELADVIATRTFVKEVEKTRDDSPNRFFAKRRSLPARDNFLGQTADVTLITELQLALFNLLPLHDLGYHGQGIIITVCDGGFTQANTLSCFRQEHELGHFDFTDDTDEFYGETGLHGTYCLSTISGLLEYEYTGAATEADYYLMRSEENDTESPKEMDNLVAALETADSLGTNVFSVSLGYAMFDNDNWTLDYSALDGKSTRVSLAATIAARKGMLVCVAAGNEGNGPWHTISAPADADSILTVGAVDNEGVIGKFSSYGPSYDGRVKPDVCAVGVQTALINVNGNVIRSNGTSFATPLLAGLAATLWSALPDENAMQIRERIIRSADRYNTPDPENHYGYGVPDAYAAYLSTATTLPEAPVSTRSVKYMQGNTLYIYHNGKTYTIFGTPQSGFPTQANQ